MSHFSPVRIDAGNPAHVAAVRRLFQGTWWAADRDEELTRRVLEGSDIVLGLGDPAGAELHAFCRVLTDGATLALVLDVVVAQHHRGTGLGRALIEHLLATDPVPKVASVELVCQPEMISFYEQFGFTAKVGRSGLMRRSN